MTYPEFRKLREKCRRCHIQWRPAECGLVSGTMPCGVVLPKHIEIDSRILFGPKGESTSPGQPKTEIPTFRVQDLHPNPIEAERHLRFSRKCVEGLFEFFKIPKDLLSRKTRS